MNLKEAMAYTRALPRDEYVIFLAHMTETMGHVKLTLWNVLPQIAVDVGFDDGPDDIREGISIDQACQEFGISARTDVRMSEDAEAPEEGDEDYEDYREWQTVLKLLPVQEPAYFTKERGQS